MMQFTQNSSGSFLVPYAPSASRKTQILLPEGASERKIVAYKMRFKHDEPWYGDTRRCAYNFDIDQKGEDGVSFRDQIHIWLTGKLERAYGDFIYQDGDQMWSSVYIREWPEVENTPGQWAKFVRYEPGKDAEWHLL